MAKVLGIDEAGRGPVIGPLVIAGVMLDESKLDLVSEARDSKLLSRDKREQLFSKYKKIKHKLIIINPGEIDEAVESKSLNLNWLEAIKSSMIINFLKPDKVILDCPSNNIKKYVDYVRMLLKNKKIELVGEHKAERYHIVAAASIIAKVTRDKEIEKIKKKYGDIGSGYPSDSVTQKFLEKNWNKYPEIFRKSWKSWKNLSEKL